MSKKDIPIAELLRNFYSRALIIPFLKGIDWRKDFLEVLELLETMETIENLPFRHISLKSDTLIITIDKFCCNCQELPCSITIFNIQTNTPSRFGPVKANKVDK